ncbi:MAG: hypothetical protein ACYTG0_25075 [Planctomycetota bacterium]|jgi:hypothetical protein
MAVDRRGFLAAVAGLPAAYWLHDNKRAYVDEPVVDEKVEQEVSSESTSDSSRTSSSTSISRSC